MRVAAFRRMSPTMGKFLGLKLGNTVVVLPVRYQERCAPIEQGQRFCRKIPSPAPCVGASKDREPLGVRLPAAGAKVSQTKSQVDVDLLSINTIRTLAIDAVQQANSGHPGAPMGLAPVVYCLWPRYLHYDPMNPTWPNRDRFVLSAGHASMLLYATLHLAGVRAADASGQVSSDLA